MLFSLAAMGATWYGGIGPGVGALLMGGAVGDYYFLRPHQEADFLSSVECADIVTYAAMTGMMIALIEALRRAWARAEKCHLLSQTRGEQLLNGMRQINAAEARIRDLAELEQRVRERASALESANRELEAFSYSVSHDLRAPLRSIYGFSQAVLEDYRDRLDDRGVMYLQYACDASQRLSRLIEDLMEMSRVNRGDLRREEVDLSALAWTVTSELQRLEPQRSLETIIAPGLVAQGDHRLLRLALENLMSNAWKFTSKLPWARVEMGAMQRNGGRLYYVRDNGAGFSMAHAERLFGVFQRLHSVDEFPGTGIGLATVKRIVMRHGGDIWAEGKVNEGATFYFTLPEQPKPADGADAPSPPQTIRARRAHPVRNSCG